MHQVSVLKGRTARLAQLPPAARQQSRERLGDDWLEPDDGGPRRRRRWPVTLVVLLLVAGLGVAGVYIGRGISHSVASVSDRLRNGLGFDVPPPDPAADTYRAYARTQLHSTDQQFDCLDNLWTSESGWRPTAQNPTSTAYSIAQLLDQTWELMATNKTSDPYGQIDVGLRYIDKRYGTPCDAWDFWQDHHWYRAALGSGMRFRRMTTTPAWPRNRRDAARARDSCGAR